MDHAQAQELLPAYFRGALDREHTRAFHAHINDCEDCKVRLRAMRAGAEMGKRWSLRGEGRFGNDDDRMRQILYKNRVMTYAVVAVMVAFFIMFILKK